MATAATEGTLSAANSTEIRTSTWTLSAGETGDAVAMPGHADRSVQVFGTFGGATVIFEGSNEASPTTYATLNDPFGTALSKTLAGLFGIAEMVRYFRPRVSGGSGTSVTVILFAKR
jgi:hypothetical protein